MIVQLDSKTRIKGTERAWELQRKRNYKGGTKWESYKWFTTFRSALEEAVHREIRLHPARTLTDAIDGVSDVLQKFEKLIPSEFKFAKQINEPAD